MSEKLALITGASSGIGYWLAKELGGRGYDLVVCSAGERLNDAVRSFERLGVHVTEVSADLATREGVRQLWDAVEQLGHPLDVACINAGVGVGGLFWQTSLEQELNMVELNCAGTVQLAKYVTKQMVPLQEALDQKPNAVFVTESSGASVIIDGRYAPPPDDKDGTHRREHVALGDEVEPEKH